MARLKVCRSLYSFCSRYKNVLDFTVGERFAVLEENNDDENWCYAINKQGNIGYIPKSYIEMEQLTMVEAVNFVEDILKLIPKESEDDKTNKQKKFLMQLIEACRSYHLQQTTNSCSMQMPHKMTNVQQDDGLTYAECKQENVEPNTLYNLTENIVKSKIINEDQCEEKIGNLFNNQVNCSSEETSKINENGTKDDYILEDKCNSENSLSTVEREVIEEILKNGLDMPVENCVLPELRDCGSVTDSTNDFNCVVPASLVPALIEQIRSCTDLSYKKSQVAVATVLSCFKKELPLLSPIWLQMEENLSKCQEDKSSLIHGEDRKKLEEIFRQLWYCRNDEQQRSWPVHEDEAIIKGLLEELYRILLDADPRITCEAIQVNDYEALHLLVTYYQMEPRRTLRIAMLQIFIGLCELDQNVIDQLLSSILPMELARDMQSINDDLKRLQYSAYLLTLLFCTGQQPSNCVYDYINEKFLEFLLDMIEESDKGDEEKEAVGDQCLAVLLAFNQHHKTANENPVLSFIESRRDAKILTEKLMLLINREHDPTKLLNYCVNTPNSVMKMLSDLFSNSKTVQLFYLNDTKVLIDIIVRQLTDLPPGDNRRYCYLNLVSNIIKNSSYDEHLHQREGLQKCFNAILHQDEANATDRNIVRELITEYPDWFSLTR
ncbi:NCK-interacting protein with SH3 domain-like [Centruroides sculpturatus]|uniref:NCK-interacting protein with SH3 domain-like n=1 Tax=Centruroides sculpturatus TaxID=218467 RepID=UPI000C6D6C60|nr:NCK-interacting protein with SH3 domain-like [Centruroides sculpturatus]